MAVDNVILQFLLWFATVAFVIGFDSLAKKIMGNRHQGYLNLRLPKFLALVIASATIVFSGYALDNDLVAEDLANFLAIPYFAATSYYIAVFFRELKIAKSERGLSN